MSKIMVRNIKTGQERPMTQKSFDYLSAKKRGFEFVSKIEEPKSEVQQHMDRLRAEKAAKGTATEQTKETKEQSEVKDPKAKTA